jgi:hypothetical protein
MRHARPTLPIAALPLSVLLSTARGRLIAPPCSALHALPALAREGVRTGNPAGVAGLANGGESPTLGAEEEAERGPHDSSASSTRATASLTNSLAPIAPRRIIQASLLMSCVEIQRLTVIVDKRFKLMVYLVRSGGFSSHDRLSPREPRLRRRGGPERNRLGCWRAQVPPKARGVLDRSCGPKTRLWQQHRARRSPV